MPRQSNFELLRIIAMMLVLAVHMNYFALGTPTADELATSPAATVTRCLLETVCLICVNLFIFISGWFGIKLRREKLFNYIFQVAYFYIGLWTVMLLLGKSTIELRGIKSVLLLTPTNWFVPDYLLLLILAPLLNAFTRTADRRTFTVVVAGFFTMQTWNGWLGHSGNFGGGLFNTLIYRYLPLSPIHPTLRAA